MKLAPPLARFKFAAVVLETETFPVEFSVKLGVVVEIPEMFPDVELIDTDVEPEIVAVELMLPDPKVVKLTVAPVTLFPSVIAPLLAVVVRARALVAVNAPVGVMLLSAEIDRLVKVPPAFKVRGPAPPALFTVTLPVVATVRLGVFVPKLPMLPDVDTRDTDVDPLRTPLPLLMLPKV